MAQPRFAVEHNSDGTAIVKLTAPVKFQGEERSRLTVPRITGKHMRRAPWGLGREYTIGELCEWAAHVVEPIGVFDELDGDIARDLAVEVVLLLGKASRETGAAPSAT